MTSFNKAVTLIRYDEIALKKGNRPLFEKRLVQNIDRALQNRVKVRRIWGRVIVEDSLTPENLYALSRVFGISSLSSGYAIPLNLEFIKKFSVELVAELYQRKQAPFSFRVSARRANKQFSLSSPQINSVVGAAILEAIPQLKVDLKNPDEELGIEIHPEEAYLYFEKIVGVGGLPVGINGRVISLISGGIDSPVASYMLMKRGCKVCFVHFDSYPYTGRGSRDKVHDLVKHLSSYQQGGKLYVVSMTEIQTQIKTHCDERLATVLLRRMMYRVSCHIAQKQRALAIVTGEAVGQVASQTLENMAAVDAVSTVPVLRPLSGFDKKEIIRMAERIGTFDISARPFPDCCTIFQPKRPATKATITELKTAETHYPWESLLTAAINGAEVISC